MKITADFEKITGKIKPMHGWGQPPFSARGEDKELGYMKNAGTPYSRLHDIGGWLGGDLWVDIPNLFRDFDADENLPENYDFAFTDWLLAFITSQGTEPFFRLGVTIENEHRRRSYRIFPPKDPAKWARICEHVIRHYNEGWADGFRYGITYWEIWNEPDGWMNPADNPMWKGTMQDYFTLYEVTARHLKACFGDTIKVGGYASTGFYAWEKDVNRDGFAGKAELEPRMEYRVYFFHKFLQYISSEEHKAPMDFFSWHSYADVYGMVKHSRYCREVLDQYGFSDTEDVLNEWNTCFDERRSTAYAAAQIMAVMLAMQKESPSVLCYYDARMMGPSSYAGLFDTCAMQPYPAYYAMVSFNQAYKKGNEVETSSDDDHVFVLGAAKNGHNVLLISNINDHEVTAELDLRGTDLSDTAVLRIDKNHTYTLTGETADGGTLKLPAFSCTEIRF